MSLYKIRDIWTVFRQTELRDSLVLLLMRKTFIAYAVAAFVVTLLHLYMEFNHHKKLVYRNLTQAEVIMAPVMSEALWHLNDDLILAETRVAVFLPDIAGASILDAKGHIILQEGLLPTSEQDRPMSKEWIIDDPHDTVPFSYSSQLITHAFALQDEHSGTLLGSVQVYAANDAIWERMSNGFWLILLNAAFKTLVLWGCFIYFAARYVKQPLLSVTDAVSRIKLDRLARERLPLTHLHGELHLLGSTLNNTLDQLHVSFTEHSNVTEELRQACLELQLAYATLQQTQDQLIQSAKMATTGELLAMIAHQWRQPLGTIGNQISNLQIRVALKNAEPEYLSKELEAVQKNLKFLSMTIKDFREFLKPNKSTEQIEISEVIQRAEDLFQSALAKNGVKLVRQLEKTQPLWTCPNELQQVLMNLIQNAQDVLLENEIVQRQISIRLKQDGAQQVLEVEDNAGGIPEGLEEQIFLPYFTTKGELNGTGLGLYMSKLIVEQHLKGKISVHNSHQGACFTIRLTELAAGQTIAHKAA